MSHLFDFVFPLLLFGPGLVTGLVSASALSSGSYQRRATQSEIVFLTPTACVVFGVTLALNLVAIAVLSSSPAMLTLNWRHVMMRPDVTGGILCSSLLIAALYWSIIRWYQKTCSLVLDLEQHTYRIKDKTSSWDDIEGLGVKHTSAKGSALFFVRLKRRGQATAALNLGGFSKLDRAEAFAAQMARELRLPLMAP